MSFIIGLLTSRLAGSIGAGLSVLLLVFCLAQCSEKKAAQHDLKAANTKLTVATANLTTCQTSERALNDALEGQNRAVAAMKAEGDRRVAESAKAVSAARSVAANARKTADAILAAKPKGDACASADALILEGVR